MNLKRYPKAVIKKHLAEQFEFRFNCTICGRPSKTLTCSDAFCGANCKPEPHQIIRCLACGEPKHLEFHRSPATDGGEDQMYYICSHCGFESEPVGPAPSYLK